MILPNSDQFSCPSAVEPRQDVSVGRPDLHPGAPSPSLEADRAELTAVVIRARAGNLAAQSELVHRYSRRIAGHVRAILRQSDAIDDVTQTIFIKMIRRLPRLRDPALFESWLFTLSRHAAFDFIRASRRRPVATTSADELSEMPDSGHDDFTREIMDELDLALAQVSAVDRNLMTRFVQGDNYRDLAARHGLSTGAVKVRLHRIRPYLRTRLRAVAEMGLRDAARSRSVGAAVRLAA